MHSKPQYVWFLAFSILAVIAGLCLLFWPATSQRVLFYIIGAVVFLGGLLRIAGYLARKSITVPFRLSFAQGLLEAVIGLFILLKVEAVVSIYATILGLVMLVSAIIKLQVCLELKKANYKRWAVGAIACAVTGLMGLVFLFNPSIGAVALAICLGILLLLEGVFNIVALIALPKQINTQTVFDNLF